MRVDKKLKIKNQLFKHKYQPRRLNDSIKSSIVSQNEKNASTAYPMNKFLYRRSKSQIFEGLPTSSVNASLKFKKLKTSNFKDNKEIQMIKDDDSINLSSNFKDNLEKNKLNLQSNLSEISSPNNAINSSTTALNSGYKSNTFLLSNRASSVKRLKVDAVEKINYDKFVFNMHYQRKLKFLDNLSSKEIAFQKKLLSLKRNEKFEVPNFEKNKIEDEAENFFKKELKSRVSVFLIDESKKKLEIKNKSANRVIKEQLEAKIILSLDTKKIRQLEKVDRDIQREIEEAKNKYSGNLEAKNKYSGNLDVKETLDNKEFIELIEKDLDFISNSEMKLQKEINPLKYKKENIRKTNPYITKPKRSLSAAFMKISKKESTIINF